MAKTRVSKKNPNVRLTESQLDEAGFVENGGQDLVEIDETALYAAALTHASFEQLGIIFGVDGGRLKDPLQPWRAIIEKARAEKKQELLAAQFKSAITDRNPTMQIWLGKQYLGQQDVQRTEHTGANGKPIEVARAKAVAYFPQNGRQTRQQLQAQLEERTN